MTRQERQEAAGMGPERLEQERNRWQMLKTSVEAMRNHPLMPELERVGAQAGALWQRNAMLMNMPEGGDQMVQNWERMGELYNRAMELRARMLGTRMQSTFGAAPGADLRGEVLDGLNQNFSVDGGSNNSAMRGVNRLLTTYAQGLTADPNSILDGTSTDGYFYARNRRTGRFNVNWNRVEDAYRNIDMIAGSPIASVNPGQREMLQRMRAGIRQVESVDPVGMAIADWRRSYPRRQTDHRPLRFLTAVGASFITGIGLITGAKRGFTWPTALWAGVAALSINPDLARSGAYNSVRRLNFLNQGNTQNMMVQAGLTGDRGAAVLEELQELRREHRAEFDRLARMGNPTTMAQIGRLTGGRNTPLTEALSRFATDGERSQFLRTFAQPQSRDEQQIVREFIRGRGRVDMRLEQNPMLFG